MGFAEALFYFAIARYFWPKTREEVPFKQFGFDVDQFLLYFVEVGLLEAAVFEAYKGFICILDSDYGYSKAYCPKPIAIEEEQIEEAKEDEEKDEDEKDEK
mmetsp:Transcript_12563/g.16122  ORF Transcript_12563/g.16122 Transcript_12563/m.16122 type:complete len:101 (+) Transcript_12563:1-303(+)